MIRYAISIPIKKYQGTCTRNAACFLPLSMTFKPINSIFAQRKLRHCTRFYQSSLFPTPTDKAGTPFHIRIKSIPSPVFFPITTSNFLFCHLHNLSVSKYSAKDTTSRIVSLNMRNILRISISWPTKFRCLFLAKLQCIFQTITAMMF